MSLLKVKLSEITETTKTFLIFESFTIGPKNQDDDKTHLIAEFLVVDKRGTNPDVPKIATRKQVIRDLSGATDPALAAAITTICTYAKAAYDQDNPITP